MYRYIIYGTEIDNIGVAISGMSLILDQYYMAYRVFNISKSNTIIQYVDVWLYLYLNFLLISYVM